MTGAPSLLARLKRHFFREGTGSSTHRPDERAGGSPDNDSWARPAEARIATGGDASPWDLDMTGAAAGIYVGVFRNPDLLEGPFLRQLRCDDPLLPGSRDRYAAFVFDDGATGAIFGWEGVFTPFNNLANMALARQLSRCGEIGVRTVLIGTGESSFKPFYGTFAESFDEVHPGFDSFEKTHIAARSR